MRLSAAPLALVIAACGQPPTPSDEAPRSSASPPPALHPSGPPKAPLEVLSADLLREHTKALSDDTMQGRKPGTEGGRRTVGYISTAMKDLGLEPAGEDGWTQRVRMRGVTTDASTVELAFNGGRGSDVPLQFGTAFVGGSYQRAGSKSIHAPLVFAGYGVTAPEYDWDDYAGLDAKGKVVVVFVGDPPVDDDRFAGEAMTYYGRWTYKFERALEAGALGCLVIHETEPASYGWNVVRNSWSGERIHIVEPNGKLPAALDVQGWISTEAAQALAKKAGTSLARWHEAALKKFKAVDIPVTLSGTWASTERRFSDDNVLGRIPGATRPEEAVFVTAHWDHLGTNPTAQPGEDAVFNGAVDNASGIAGMLGVAAAIQAGIRHGDAPSRSIVFFATTAEEQGLQGARYYAANPLVPLEKIAGVVNIDSMNVHGRTKTIQVVGPGQSTMEDVLREVAEAQGRTIVPDERPSAGGYYRSDQFAFARRGVPGLYFRGGTDMEHGGLQAGREIAAGRAARYHTVEDNYDPQWSFEGTEQDAEAVMEVVLRIANADKAPQWKPSSEFARIKR